MNLLEKDIISFNKEKIEETSSQTLYYIQNNNGIILEGTNSLKKAMNYANRYQKEYDDYMANKGIRTIVFDIRGNKIYDAKEKKKIENEEEFE